jgi:hypothetical protein
VTDVRCVSPSLVRTSYIWPRASMKAVCLSCIHMLPWVCVSIAVRSVKQSSYRATTSTRRQAGCRSCELLLTRHDAAAPRTGVSVFGADADKTAPEQSSTLRPPRGEHIARGVAVRPSALGAC